MVVCLSLSETQTELLFAPSDAVLLLFVWCCSCALATLRHWPVPLLGKCLSAQRCSNRCQRRQIAVHKRSIAKRMSTVSMEYRFGIRSAKSKRQSGQTQIRINRPYWWKEKKMQFRYCLTRQVSGHKLNYMSIAPTLQCNG